MFLQWIHELGFLEPDPDSSVYLHFPVKSRMLLASHTANYLLRTDTESNYLATPMQIHVTLEALGPGFDLPVEGHYETIESVTDVYRKWLLSPDSKPDALKLQQQIFYRKMFKHFSLLFEARGSMVELQSQLCSRVLLVLEQCGKEIGDTFDTETWETLLKIVLGSADRLLGDPADTLQHLSTKLCPLLLKVLFGLWFRSKTTNEYLWSNLAKLVYRWRHRLPLIVQWTSMISAFNMRVINILYGGKEGSENLSVTEYDGEVTTYDYDEELTFFYWHKILYLLDNVNSIVVPVNHHEVMKGVNTIVNQLLHVGNKDVVSSQVPDGNTILSLLSMYTFDNIHAHIDEDDKGAFDKGKAQAFMTATNIISTKAKTTDFDKKYLASFYYTIQMYIRHNNYLMSVIIYHSTALFNLELPGCRVLVPYYLEAIKTIMSASKLDKIAYTFSTLRESAIKLLGTILPYPAHFNEISIAETKESSCIEFCDIHHVFSEILIDALGTEENSDNRQYLLWTCQAYIMGNLPDYPVLQSFTDSIIDYVLAKITENVWTVDDVLAGLNLLSQLSKLLRYQSTKNAVKVVTTLTIFIETSFQTGRVAENIITRALYTIADWLMAGDWIHTNQQILSQVLSALELGIGAKTIAALPTSSNNSPSTPKTLNKYPSPSISRTVSRPSKMNGQSKFIKDVSLVVYVRIMTQIDNFPVRDLGPSRLSSLYNEQDIMKMYNMVPQDIVFYAVGDHTLLSIAKHKRLKGTRQKVTVIFRDMTGKYVWNSEMSYGTDTYREPTSYTSSTYNSFKPYKWPPVEYDELLVQTAKEVLTPTQYELYEKVLKGARRVAQQSREVSEAKVYPDLKVKRATPQPIDDSTDSTTVRLFMHHFGYRSSNYNETFYALDGGNNFQEDLYHLDNVLERDAYQIGILYINRGQNDESVILKNRLGSNEYLQFVQNLGWLVCFIFGCLGFMCRCR